MPPKPSTKAIWTEAVGDKLEELGVRGTEIDWDVVSRFFFTRNGSEPWDDTVKLAAQTIYKNITKDNK